MNAYELADKLDLEPYGIYGEQAANMLRQQADRIKDLEKLLEHSVGADCREMRYIQEIENRDARIAELEKDLAKYDELAIDDLEGKRIIWCACGDAITPDSGAVCGVCASFRSTKEQSAEPVAWIKKDTLIFLGNYEFGSITIQVQKQKDNEFDIPLYTTPRELSDEEIDSLIAEYKIGEFSGFYVDKAMTESMQRRYKNVLDFARAILKKAIEK